MSVVSFAVCALFLFGGCSLYGNDRSGTTYIASEESDGKTVFYLTDGEALVWGNDEFSIENSLPHKTQNKTVLSGSTFPRSVLQTEAEYAGLADKLKPLAVNEEDPYMQAYALKAADDTAYGFCNVYSSATGYLSGGGQIDAEKIVRGVYFSYDAQTDELTVQDEIEKGCIVAFNQTHLVYFYCEAYYAKAIGTDSEPVKICEDDAYDKGFTNYSYASFYFDDSNCILKFHCDSNNKPICENYVLCKMDGTLLARLQLTD